MSMGLTSQHLSWKITIHGLYTPIPVSILNEMLLYWARILKCSLLHVIGWWSYTCGGWVKATLGQMRELYPWIKGAVGLLSITPSWLLFHWGIPLSFSSFFGCLLLCMAYILHRKHSNPVESSTRHFVQRYNDITQLFTGLFGFL